MLYIFGKKQAGKPGPQLAMMTLTPNVFTEIPLFAGLNVDERADLLGFLTQRSYDPQQTVFWIGEEGNEFYIVEWGNITISYTADDGKEVTLATLGPGQFFGELSLLAGGRRTGTARAVVASRLLALGREQFHAFIKKHPASAIHMMEVLGRRQKDNLEKLRTIKNANVAVEEQRTRGQRVVEGIAAVFASGRFLALNLIFFAIWIIVQTIVYQEATKADPDTYKPITFIDQPPTFFWLGFMVALESIMLSIFVLNAQRRQTQRDSIKADLDYQVNRKAQLEIMQLHEKMDRLETAVLSAVGKPAEGNGRNGN